MGHIGKEIWGEERGGGGFNMNSKRSNVQYIGYLTKVKDESSRDSAAGIVLYYIVLLDIHVRKKNNHFRHRHDSSADT